MKGRKCDWVNTAFFIKIEYTKFWGAWRKASRARDWQYIIFFKWWFKWFLLEWRYQLKAIIENNKLSWEGVQSSINR